MKILITGAAGYIGSVLTEELLKSDYEVIALDNFMYGQTSLLHLAHYKNFSVVRGDARDKNLISKYISDAEFIIPLAAIVGAPASDRDPIAAKTTNLDAIKMILELRKSGQKIIYPNTNSGYGIGQKDKYCDETTPLNPISLYGRLKVEAEKEILGAGDAIAFRLATVFGISPRMRLDLLVNDFVYRAVTDRSVVLFEADFKRNYIHIHDVARAFLHAINNFDSMKNEPYNVGLSNVNLSKRELCEEIKKQIPDFVYLESKIGKDPDKRDYIVSNAKIEKTGFKLIFSLEEGIEELIRGYKIIRRNQFSNL